MSVRLEVEVLPKQQGIPITLSSAIVDGNRVWEVTIDAKDMPPATSARCRINDSQWTPWVAVKEDKHTFSITARSIFPEDAKPAILDEDHKAFFLSGFLKAGYKIDLSKFILPNPERKEWRYCFIRMEKVDTNEFQEERIWISPYKEGEEIKIRSDADFERDANELG